MSDIRTITISASVVLSIAVVMGALVYDSSKERKIYSSLASKCIDAHGTWLPNRSNGDRGTCVGSRP